MRAHRRHAARPAAATKTWTLNTLANAKAGSGFCGPKGALGATGLFSGPESNARRFGQCPLKGMMCALDSGPGKSPAQKPEPAFAFAHG